MDKRIGLMGPMAVDPIGGTCHIEMKRSELEGSWIIQTGEAMNIGFILVLVLTGGVIWDIFWMILRKKSHLHAMVK